MPGTPLVIEPGEEVDFTVAYIPSGLGATDTCHHPDREQRPDVAGCRPDRFWRGRQERL